MLIYLLWDTGLYSNHEIGEQFGITYSAVSRRITITRTRMEDNLKFKRKFETLKSLINRLSENEVDPTDVYHILFI